MKLTLDAVIAAMKADGDWHITEAGRKFLERYEASKQSETERQLKEALAKIARMEAQFPVLGKVA